MHLTIAAASLLFAQALPSEQQGLPSGAQDVPDCAAPLLFNIVDATGCSLTDRSCLCARSGVQDIIETLIAQTCSSTDDREKVGVLASQICADAATRYETATDDTTGANDATSMPESHQQRTMPALVVLHYLAPIAAALYYLSAKTVAICLLQQPSKHAISRVRRWSTIILQFTIALSIVAEGLISSVQALREPDWYASKDYVVYLVVSLALQTSFAVSIIEHSTVLWHPYAGAWLMGLSFEIPIIILQGLEVSGDDFSKGKTACNFLRALFLFAIVLITGWFMLCDRRRGIRLDEETEALLEQSDRRDTLHGSNGQTSKVVPSPTASLCRSDVAGSSREDESDDDDGFDSDSEEPERDKELRAQQKQRLQESGNWLSYLKEFKIFLPMLLPRKDRMVQGCFVIIAFCLIAGRALSILVPRQLGLLTDELTTTATTGVAPWRTLGLWMLFASLRSGAGLPLLEAIAKLPVQQYGYKMIATTAFRHVMHLSMDFHNEKNSGELIRAIEQGTNLQDLIDFIFFEVGPMFVDLVVAFVYVAILFDVYMAMILFAVGVAYVWVGAKVTVWSIKQRRDFNTAWRLESKVQNEAINNWQTVSHFNRGKFEAIRYSDTVDAFNLAEWRYYLAYDLGGGAQSFIMLVGRLLAMSLAVYRVSQGHAPVGNFITLYTYWSSIESPLANVSYSVRRVSAMLTDSERLLQLLTTKPSIDDAPGAADIKIDDGEVEFDNVDFAYDPRKPTLRDVNFVIKPGQTVALVGETGGGKSTILKLLYRYYDVAGGAIRIDGQDIRNVTLDSLRDSFGMVPQDPSLFNISIMENIKYARLDATDEDVKDACRAAAIHDKIESFPDGYNAKVGERGVKLSGGELQRVSIARAILRQPKIVLLDEATSMIDAETEAIIQGAFRRLTSNRTTFIVAHRLSTIQHADLILVINDGQIIERGTHDELFRKKGKYVALWSKQLSKDVKDVGMTLDVKEDDEALIELQGDSEQQDNSGSSA